MQEIAENAVSNQMSRLQQIFDDHWDGKIRGLMKKALKLKTF